MNPPESPPRAKHEHAARVRHLFDAVLDLGPDERPARLSREQDAAVRQDAAALLAAHDCADEVLRPLEQPPACTDALLHQRVAHFQVLEVLGGGGMGMVYKAWDTALDRPVALKFLPPRLGTDDRAKARLVAEAKAASVLDHPNIAVVHEIGEHEGRLFIAMACYEGETLKEKIARGPLPIEEAVDYAVQIAEGLQAAHGAGIIHRDVKPANVIVAGQGRVKIVDFGLAKAAGAELTRRSAAMGTVAYMSPEQTRGGAIDERTDLWSLGVVLFEVLAGQKPFRGESDRTLVHAIRHDAPEPVEHACPEAPAGLAALVRRCLTKDPAERYQTAEALLDDLLPLREGPPAIRRARPRRGQVWAYGSAALLMLLVVAVGSLLLATSSGTAALDSIAVLPMTNLSGDPEQEYFADGMTDLLINQFSQIGGFERVIARTSVMPYKNTEKSPQEIGRELGVDALVEASALRSGERVRINVNLIEAETGRTLWSRSFERSMRDVLTLQRDVAQAIGQEIEVQLRPEDVARLQQTVPEVNPEALALYLRATRNRKSGYWGENVADLEQAVALDSIFAKAHASLAGAYALQTSDYARAEEAVTRALALDPNLPMAHIVRGLIRQWAHYDWTGAEAALRRAAELAPLDALAHHELAMLLMRRGRFDEALAAARRALYLDPTSVHFQSGVGEIYLYSRRYEDAVREFEKALRMDPDRFMAAWHLGHAYLFAGRHEEAIRTYERGWGVPPYAYAMLGRRSQAEALLGSMLARPEHDDQRAPIDLAMTAALTYTSLGEHEPALDWLERAVDEHLGWIPIYLKVLPHLDPLRGEPRFQALLEKTGLE